MFTSSGHDSEAARCRRSRPASATVFPLTEITGCLAARKRAYASRVAPAADAVVRSPRR